MNKNNFDIATNEIKKYKKALPQSNQFIPRKILSNPPVELDKKFHLITFRRTYV